MKNNEIDYSQTWLARKRKLVGINGRRFFNIPGVIYPQEVLTAKPGHNPRTGRPHTTPPAWGMNTAEASQLLQCSAAAARIHLHRHNIRFQIVQIKGQPRQIYWSRRQIARLVKQRVPSTPDTPAGYLSSVDVANMLGVSRTTLMRYSKRGLLHPLELRKQTPYGLRTQYFYPEREVQLLATARQRWQSNPNPLLPLEAFLPAHEDLP